LKIRMRCLFGGLPARGVTVKAPGQAVLRSRGT
jgi:hypothetical protein